jgi:hypothetical protein
MELKRACLIWIIQHQEWQVHHSNKIKEN